MHYFKLAMPLMYVTDIRPNAPKIRGDVVTLRDNYHYDLLVI